MPPSYFVKLVTSNVRDFHVRKLDDLRIAVIRPDAECDHMREHRIGRTASKQVLGSLNELTFQLEYGLHDRPERSHLEHALWLSKTPCKLIEYDAPDRATQAAFMSATAVAKARDPTRS